MKPGYNADSKIYYAGPEIVPADHIKLLDEMLQEFCFATPGDRANFLGLLLTPLLMPMYLFDDHPVFRIAISLQTSQAQVMSCSHRKTY